MTRQERRRIEREARKGRVISSPRTLHIEAARAAPIRPIAPERRPRVAVSAALALAAIGSILVACSTDAPAVAPYRDAPECPPAQSCPVRYPCPGLPCVAIADCTVATPTTSAVCACTVRALVDPLTVATQDVVVVCFGL